jgi:hypothetical protein
VLHIPAEVPTPIATPKFDPVGVPVERIGSRDGRWTWRGNWTEAVSTKSGPEKISSDKGAEASVDFEGTGVMVVGPYLAEGGTADVYIDGKLDRSIDVCSDEKLRKAFENVYHNFYLPPGRHTLRLVVRGERFKDSGGSEVRLGELVVLRPAKTGG